MCCQGLGLVITGTMPVFNLTIDTVSSQVKKQHMQHKTWSLK